PARAGRRRGSADPAARRRRSSRRAPGPGSPAPRRGSSSRRPPRDRGGAGDACAVASGPRASATDGDPPGLHGSHGTPERRGVSAAGDGSGRAGAVYSRAAMRAASAALLAAATLAACGDNNPAFELEAGCQPLLAGHHCALPYPSDFFRVEDPSTATGYRIEMTAAAHLETNQGASANVHEVVPADGFSHIPTIVAVLPDEVSAA